MVCSSFIIYSSQTSFRTLFYFQYVEFCERSSCRKYLELLPKVTGLFQDYLH